MYNLSGTPQPPRGLFTFHFIAAQFSHHHHQPPLPHPPGKTARSAAATPRSRPSGIPYPRQVQMLQMQTQVPALLGGVAWGAWGGVAGVVTSTPNPLTHKGPGSAPRLCEDKNKEAFFFLVPLSKRMTADDPETFPHRCCSAPLARPLARGEMLRLCSPNRDSQQINKSKDEGSAGEGGKKVMRMSHLLAHSFSRRRGCYPPGL